MKEILEKFFEKEKIEYFGIIPYSECREVNKNLLNRMGFAPKSVIVYLVPYYTGKCENISVYAASLDYHAAIEEINSRLKAFLCKNFSENNFAGYGDRSPIDERYAASRLGLGILGKNGLLINRKYGSYVFIADMVTNIEIPISNYTPCEILSCENCGKCKQKCPSGTLADKNCACLSQITQKKGTLTESEARLIKEVGTAWGCDLCQSVCPHNRNPHPTPLEFFYKDRIEKLTLENLEKMSDEEFSRRAFAWRGKETVLRNLRILEND
jgi:epoxyqueuosine reductase QueG